MGGLWKRFLRSGCRLSQFDLFRGECGCIWKGEDVFFTTISVLLLQDYGLIDLYDARVDGGFSEPEPLFICEGEACQGPLTPPPDLTLVSSTYNGSGNVKPKKTCPKGKHKVKKNGKYKCVKKKKGEGGKAGKRVSVNRRAER